MDKNLHQEALVSQNANQLRLVISEAYLRIDIKMLLYIIMPPKKKTKSLTQLQKQYFTKKVDKMDKKKLCCHDCSKPQHCTKKCDQKKS
jgi:hypothetical protein